jgi:MFS family permease
MFSRFGNPARTLLTIYIPSAIMGLGQGMIVPTIPALVSIHDVPPGIAAQIVTAQLLGRALSNLPGGVLIDRLGAKAVMLLGLVLAIGGSLSTAFGSRFALLLLAQFFVGVGANLWMVGREISAVELVRSGLRGRVLSSLFGVTSVGVAAGPVLGGVIADSLDVRLVFVVYAGLALLVMVISAFVPGSRRPRSSAPSSGTARAAGKGGIPPQYRLTFLILTVGTFAAQQRQFTMNSVFPLLVVTALGYSSTQLGWLFGIIGLVNLLMIGAAGYVSDAWGRKAATVPAAALTGLAFLLYPVAHGLLELGAISVIVGVATGFALGSMTIYSYDIVPRESRGKYQGLRRSAGELGAITGPMLGGFIATALSPAAVFLSFAPLHLVTAALLAFVAREPRRTGRSRATPSS